MGCTLPPLARVFYQTPGARPAFGGAPIFFETHGTGASLYDACKSLVDAKEEYDGDHPPLFPLSAEEDFVACLADGSVVRFCRNVRALLQ